MKYLSLIIVCLLLLGNTSFSQIKIGETVTARHRINISYTPQWYPNAAPIKHSGSDYNIGQVLYPKKNMMGHNWGVEYQYTGKKGLVLSIGMQSGVQSHKVRVRYNLGYVNEANPIYKDVFFDTSYSGRVNYTTLRFMAGYCLRNPFKFAPGWDIEGKAGIALRFYKKTDYAFHRWSIVMQTAPDTIEIRDIGDETVLWGRGGIYGGSSLNLAGDFYIGVNKNVNWSVIRSLAIGIEGTMALRGGTSGYIREDLAQPDPDNPGIKKTYSISEYAPRDFALGLRMTVGFGYWK